MDEGLRRSSFPALDPEPPAPPLSRRLLAMAIGIAVVALAVAAAIGIRNLTLAGGSAMRASPGPGTTLPGGIVFWSSKWVAVGVATPDARHARQLSVTLQDPGGVVSGWASPDDRTLLLPDGEAFDLKGSAQVLPHGLVSPTLLGSWFLADQPWADRGARLLLQRSDASAVQLSLVAVANGVLAPLGRTVWLPNAPDYGNYVQIWNRFLAADPIAPGAASVTAASDGSLSVQLITLGKKPVTLLSDRLLARLASIPVGKQVGMSLIGFSHDGQLLAVYGWQIVNQEQLPQGSDQIPPNRWAVVVVDRSGRLIATLPGDPSVTAQTAVWAGDNKLVMWVGHQGLSALVWNISGHPRITPIARAATTIYSPTCLAAPDGGHVLCGTGSGWVDIDATTGASSYYTDVPGWPLAWVAKAPQ